MAAEVQGHAGGADPPPQRHGLPAVHVHDTEGRVEGAGHDPEAEAPVQPARDRWGCRASALLPPLPRGALPTGVQKDETPTHSVYGLQVVQSSCILH